VTDATLPIREGEALPRWARVLVTIATHKNAVRWSAEPFKTEDLIALWNEGEGRCMLTNLPFRETQVGAGKARRPFVPSLDRIGSRLFGRLPPSTSSRPCPAGIRKPLTTADLRPTPPLDGLQPSVPETVGGTTLTCRQAVTALSFCSAPNGGGYHP
jgi:hypothetical protein